MNTILQDFEWLKDKLPEQMNPVEEKHLAHLLETMNSHEMAILKAAVEHNIHPGGMKEFIDLASSVGNWPVASEVSNDTQLGRFLFDNGMLTQEEHEAATMKLNVTNYPDDYFALLGKKHREAENGFLCDIGYVENTGIVEAVVPDEIPINEEKNGGAASLEIPKADGPISAFITNLGKYNEGHLVGKWHSFPTTPEEIAQTMQEIGIDGKKYEEFFITDYDTNIEGIHDALPEYANLDELNYLAAKLDELEVWELEKFQGIAELGDHSHNISDLINITENLDGFDFTHGVDNDYDYGYYWIEEAGVYDLKSMGNLAQYIDYERFGHDIHLEDGGQYVTGGYVVSRDDFTEHYTGLDDIPDEYKVFSSGEEPEIEPDKKTITVLLVEPEQIPREVTVEHTLDNLQELVGGMIEAVYPYEDPVALICNDEGKLNGMALNRALDDENGKMYDILAGSFFICGLGEGNFTSLPKDLMEKFNEKFHAPEQFVKLAGQIVAVKMPVEKNAADVQQEKDKPKQQEPER